MQFDKAKVKVSTFNSAMPHWKNLPSWLELVHSDKALPQMLPFGPEDPEEEMLCAMMFNIVAVMRQVQWQTVKQVLDTQHTLLMVHTEDRAEDSHTEREYEFAEDDWDDQLDVSPWESPEHKETRLWIPVFRGTPRHVVTLSEILSTTDGCQRRGAATHADEMQPSSSSTLGSEALKRNVCTQDATRSRGLSPQPRVRQLSLT